MDIRGLGDSGCPVIHDYGKILTCLTLKPCIFPTY